MSRKYFQIRSSAIQRSDFQVKQVRTFTQNRDLLTLLFEKYGVPDRYQKIFVRKNAFDKLEDFFSGVDFEIKITSDKRINLLLKKKTDQPNIDYHVYAIYGNEGKISYSQLMSFYKTLHKEGYLRGYLRAINEYFILGIDLDYLFELNDTYKSIGKQKRLYRKRMRENN